MISKLQESLAQLGNTAEEVKQNLSRLGCRGRMYYSCRCPVAHYLMKQGFDLLGVSQEEISLRGGWDLPTPEPIKNFVVRFDRGEWPDLIG